MDQQETRPSLQSRSSRSSSRSLTLDLSNLPPLVQPTPPSNTLLITNLPKDVFQPDNLQTIRDLVAKLAPIHAWSPLKSFRRIVVSFFNEDDAIKVRSVWDGEAIMGERCRVYFGQPTPTDLNPADSHLALPDAGKLFFISPPPSPPHGWEMRLEDAPNKVVHAEDLADALARLRHTNNPNEGLGGQSPVSPADSTAPGGFGCRTRSRSSTLIFQPEQKAGAPDLPSVLVDDMTDEPDHVDASPALNPRPMMVHTERPPVDFMQE